MVVDGLTSALNIASSSPKGLAWPISEEWAKRLILNNHLELTQRHYNITGEKSALFLYNGETIRLEKTWRGMYNLYHGDWEPNPHWTGD